MVFMDLEDMEEDGDGLITGSDGVHQQPINPNARIVRSDGGQTPVGHVPSGLVPVGHTVIGQFSVPLGQISAGFTPPIIPAVPTGVHTPVVQTHVPSVPPVVPVAPVMPTVPAAHAEKPEKFNGTNFKRWQQKMHFYLTTLHMDRFLKEEPPLFTAESNMQTVYAADAWKHSDYICRNYVLNCLSDSLYNVYSAKPTAKVL
ncbi:hypothetical protein AgCh_012073 [Apium graveolens]